MNRWLMPVMLALLLSTGLGATWAGLEYAIPWIWMTIIIPVASFYFIKGRNSARTYLPALAVIVATTLVLASPAMLASFGIVSNRNQGSLRRFSSYEELKNFVGSQYSTDGTGVEIFTVIPPVFAPGVKAAEDSGFSVSIGNGSVNMSTDYSTTNVQVEGVDEADIVKTDGTYLYILSKGRVVILMANPAEEARILSTIKIEGIPLEIFVNGDKLVVFEGLWGNLIESLKESRFMYIQYPEQTRVEIYDISDRENPKLSNKIELSGGYFSSRMIGDYVYVVANMSVIYENEHIILPQLSIDSMTKTVPATDIYYFDNIHYPYVFATITAIDVQNAKQVDGKVLLTTQANCMYVSLNNIYIAYTNGRLVTVRGQDEWVANTTIHRISISDGKIEYRARGEVPGQVLNQFSMDEYNGYFRIATTTGDMWSSSAQNNVYVLGDDLSVVGKIEGLAPGERIYSARFMGNRVYLVTFLRVDPLFVIDLSDPTNPKVMGELKIPGYSDYLHPYDETHIIGLGKETTDSPGGDFALYQGVKLALFDVSNPENPKEISKYLIGERGTDSFALSDHRAFLFSRSKNLLVIPITLVEGEQQNWQGAYVFDISLTGGLVLKGRITHSDFMSPERGWDYTNFVMRSLYIDDVLYTVSEDQVKMNSLADLGEINSVPM